MIYIIFSFTSVIFTAFVIFWFNSLKCSKSQKSIYGKHVLVTGGSSGIGKSFAIEAFKLGANVTIVARNEQKLKEAGREIERFRVFNDQKIECISLDVSSNYERICEVLSKMQEELGPVFMLVNCAGMALGSKLEDMEIDEIYHLINLNFIGTVHVTKALVAEMKVKSKGGYIIITASQAALFGIFGFSVYSSTKYALRGFAEALQMETKPYEISVTLGLPPDTDTPGFENEEKTKPLETKLISQTGGLYKPEVVAKQLMRDALRRKFFSTVGFEGRLLTLLSGGMTPVSNVLDFILQVCFYGLFRLVALVYRKHFDNIIKKCMMK